MSAALRKLTAIISKARTVVIFTNQIREKVGIMFAHPKPSRRRALKFTAPSAATSVAPVASRPPTAPSPATAPN